MTRAAAAAFAAVLALAAPALAEAAGAAGLSVKTTPIAEIVRNDRAKAVLEAQLPGLKAYYGRVGSVTLATLARYSRGRLPESKLKAIQAEFDKIN